MGTLSKTIDSSFLYCILKDVMKVLIGLWKYHNRRVSRRVANHSVKYRIIPYFGEKVPVLYRTPFVPYFWEWLSNSWLMEVFINTQC